MNEDHDLAAIQPVTEADRASWQRGEAVVSSELTDQSPPSA